MFACFACFARGSLFGEDTDMPVLAEIQIHLQSVVDLKKDSHKLYQVTRALTAADARG